METQSALDPAVLPAFVATTLLFLAPPGPDMAYVVAVGLDRGRGAAVLAILGIGLGMAVYASAVVVGVAGLAQTHPTVLDVVKCLGAAYLVWLAVQTARHARSAPDRPRTVSRRAALPRGLVVSLTNPKVLLFFLAVLPQFVGDAENVRAQLAVLGTVNVATEVALYGTIGVLAGSFHARFASSTRAGVVLSRVASIVYLVLAAAVLVEVVTGGSP